MMTIKKSTRDKIGNEIEYVVDSMNKTEDLLSKLYFFSAIHGLINRIFNMDYDPELVFIHQVLSSVHTGFLQRIDSIRKGDPVINLDESYFEKLIELSIVLKEKIAENNDVSDVLKDFMILAYATTGNGYYLKQKGLLKF